MRCPVCNAEISADMAFCTNCGSAVTSAAPEPIFDSAPMMNQNMNFQPTAQNAGFQPMGQCKRCGTPVPLDAKKCPRCGRGMKSHAGLVLGIIAILVIIALAAALVYMYLLYTADTGVDEEIEALEAAVALKDSEISSLKDDNDALTDENDRLERRVSALEDDVDSADTELANLQTLYDEALEKNRFYDTYIVFYLEDGTNLYHKYGCPMLEGVGSRFYAYNKNAAIGRGYDPCYRCVNNYYY